MTAGGRERSSASAAATLGSPVPEGAGTAASAGHRPGGPGMAGRGGWLPTWPLISTKHLELRKRRGLMAVVFLLTIGLPVVVLGFRLLFHEVDPHSYGPAGSPSVFQAVANLMGEFSFIIAAALGATAGSTDLTDGVFRHLVITGRSRLALYLARIPAGLSVLLPLVAAAFLLVCLVTIFAGTTQPTSLDENGVSIPLHMDQSQLEHWLLQHPRQTADIFGPGKVIVSPQGPPRIVPLSPAAVTEMVHRRISTLFRNYTSTETSQLNPADNEMVKVGLWLELEVGIGLMVGLGLGSVMGQRTVPTILMVVLEILATPILAVHVIPYFIDGQRLIVGVAMDQLRPALLAGGAEGGGGRAVLGGRGLGIPPMPTWAMVAVIVGWIVGWTGIGAWRMTTRDA